MTTAAQLKTEIEKLDQKFGNNRLLLFSMGLRLRTLDYEMLAGGFLTDGPDDKKIDFCKIDEDSGVAFVAQGFESPNWTTGDPPVNKARDLNTASAWALHGDLASIPRQEIRTFAQALRDGLENGKVHRVEFLYVHNRPQSANVKKELDTVAAAVNQLLSKYNKGTLQPEGIVLQASVDDVIEWFDAVHETIAVNEDVPLKLLEKPTRAKGDKWEARVGSVRAADLVALHKKYNDKLFSANVRDYLGSRQARGNINQQIELTSAAEPKNFWAYNNGITILTRAITDVTETELVLSGIAVINGAQTTGSLTKAAAGADLKDAAVLARVVKCTDPNVVQSIIRYNNSQNPVKTWDLRAIEPVQRKLVERFAELGISYNIRRGEEKRGPGDLNIDKLGSFLYAFYVDPFTAPYKTEIFEEEGKYSQIFTEASNVRNLLTVYRLGNAVYAARDQLKAKNEKGEADDSDRERQGLFRHGTFPFVMVNTVAEVLSLWFGQDKMYRKKISLKGDLLKDAGKAESSLVELINQILPAVHQELKKRGKVYEDLKSKTAMAEIATATRAFIEQVKLAQPGIYDKYVGLFEIV